MIVRASMNNSIIFGNAQMLQINIFWELSKMTITKPYEQFLTKTFYFDSPIFVEILDDIKSPPEFLQNFRKCLSGLIKYLKPTGIK